MTRPRYETFRHEVMAWTVGRLRAALADLPADMPVVVTTAQEPGGYLAGSDQVIYSAGSWNALGGLDRGPADHFSISCEFPSGTYERYVS